MGSQKLPISMSAIRIYICPMGFLQNDEICGGSTSTHGDSSSHLPRQHSSYASIIEATDTADSIDIPAIRGSGSGGQYKEIHAVPSADPEFLGFQVDTVNLQLIFSAEKLRKIQQLAQHLLHRSRLSVRDLASFVGKTSAATYMGYMASSSAFQSTTIPNEFSGTRGPLCGFRRGLQLQEVQYQSDLDQGG